MRDADAQLQLARDALRLSPSACSLLQLQPNKLARAYQLLVLGIEVQGSQGASAGPACSSSISAFLGNCRPVAGSAKVIAMGDTENGCAVTGHSHQESAQKGVVRQELMLAVRQAPQPCEAGLAKGKTGWPNRSRVSHLA
jgi:hypothetical protein